MLELEIEEHQELLHAHMCNCRSIATCSGLETDILFDPSSTPLLYNNNFQGGVLICVIQM